MRTSNKQYIVYKKNVFNQNRLPAQDKDILT
jgi:hypothetical protein